MIGDKVLAHLSQRRCQRCGQLLYHNIQVMADYLDHIYQHRAEGFCAQTVVDDIQSYVVCLVCQAVSYRHQARGW